MDYPKILYLSKDNVASLNIPMGDILGAVTKGFTEMGQGRVEMPPKLGIFPGGENFLHAMPCHIPAMQSVGLKWVSGYPGNKKQQLPYISGLLVWNDVHTGLVKAVMDCTWITTHRTAAASLLSARYLARPESTTLGIFGCGVQGTVHLKAFAAAYPIKEVHCYNPTPGKAEAMAALIRKMGLKAIVESDPANVVKNMDIVISAGPMLRDPHATLKQGWLKEGVFVSMVDYDSAWSRAALAEADLFTTDNLDQYNYNCKVKGGFKECPYIYADLSELVSGRKAGRTSPSQKIFACNLGLAMEDMAVAPLVYEAAIRNKVGTWLEL